MLASRTITLAVWSRAATALPLGEAVHPAKSPGCVMYGSDPTCEEGYYSADWCVWSKRAGPDGVLDTADDVWKAQVTEVSHTDTCTPGGPTVTFYDCEDVCGPGFVAICGESPVDNCGGKRAGHCECNLPE